MKLLKAHGLGNDYLVLTSGDALDPERVRTICHRHTGVGGDGILEPVPSELAHAGLRIWNPDGSQAEKSGNGLRIFAAWLHRHRGLPAAHSIEVPAGVVQAHVHGPGDVTVEMGRASLEPAEVPVAQALRDEVVWVDGVALRLTAVGMGNPHCVAWFDADIDLDGLPWRSWGAALEVHALFPNRTNVQFAQARGPSELHARIWERGAGETMASGSSACAVAVSGVELGRCGRDVRVVMPGGVLEVQVAQDRAVTLRGPVAEVGVIEVSDDLLR